MLRFISILKLVKLQQKVIY